MHVHQKCQRIAVKMKEQGLEWVTKVQGSGEEMEEEGFGLVAALTHMGG
jgi:hypothetical protein